MNFNLKRKKKRKHTNDTIQIHEKNVKYSYETMLLTIAFEHMYIYFYIHNRMIASHEIFKKKETVDIVHFLVCNLSMFIVERIIFPYLH